MTQAKIQSGAMQPLNASTVSPLDKGVGPLTRPLDVREAAALGWNLLKEDLSLPAAVLYQDKLEHNLRWMQQFADAYGARLAPHGKTTMAPHLFEMQLSAGAWGITLATVQQTLVAYHHGVRRVLMANQLVGRQNRNAIAELLEDRGFSYYCLVDSAELVDQLGAYYSERGRRLQVLIELGPMGGRTGVRNEAQLQLLLAALNRWRETILLCGVEIYEGVLSDEDTVRTFLEGAVNLTRRLAADHRFAQEPIVLSGAGSIWYDLVAEVFSSSGLGKEVEIVLRPGCYLTHDVGSYREAQVRILERNPVARRLQSGLIPALHVWAYVHSIPEARKAIVGLGRRDAAFDSGLPRPALYFRPGERLPVPAPPHWTMTKIMDQHAYLEISEDDTLRPGDMIGFDISHPCLTFDKWRVIPILDHELRVTELVKTFF